ncbi:MAG: hypothetical protein ACREHV_00835, partial [Rhizomicrobium sp.]
MEFSTGSRARHPGLALGSAFVLLLATAPALARGAPDSFAELANQLLPTVVNIATTETLKPGSAETALPDLPPGSPLQDLFKGFLDKDKGRPHHV